MLQYVVLPCPVVARRAKSEADAGTQFTIFAWYTEKEMSYLTGGRFLGSTNMLDGWWSIIHSDSAKVQHLG